MVEIALAMIREFLMTAAGGWCCGATLGTVLRMVGPICWKHLVG